MDAEKQQQKREDSTMREAASDPRAEHRTEIPLRSAFIMRFAICGSWLACPPPLKEHGTEPGKNKNKKESTGFSLDCGPIGQKPRDDPKQSQATPLAPL